MGLGAPACALSSELMSLYRSAISNVGVSIGIGGLSDDVSGVDLSLAILGCRLLNFLRPILH